MQKHLLLKQLLLFGLTVSIIAAPAATVRSATPQADKYGIMPSRDFVNDMCLVVDNVFQMVPWPLRADGICTNLGLNAPDMESELCPMFDLAKMMMGYLQSSYPMVCAPEGVPPPSDRDPTGKEFLLPTPLPSQLGSKGLPARFHEDTVKTLLQTEGPTYYWLYKHVMRLMAWAPCGVLGWDSTYQHPAGFEHVKTISAGIDLSGYNIQATVMPFATIVRRPTTPENQAKCREFVQSQKALLASQRNTPRRASAQRAQDTSKGDMCAGDELVVIIRGTTSAADWQYDVDLGFVSNTKYGRGSIHKGFVRLTDSLWEDGFKAVLDQVGSSLGSITFTGHSLGAAAASLLASRTQMHFAATGASTRVTAVLFGGPNVGDAAFTADYNRRVNTRNVDFFADIVPQVPCVGNMVECTQRAAGTPQPSSNTTIKSLHYQRLGGSITLTPANMPLQQDAWSSLAAYTQEDFCDNMMSLASQFEATHMCSYMCALSSGTEEAGNWCLLWDNIDTAAARLKQAGSSFCMSGFNMMTDNGDFPTFPLFPSLKDPTWLAKQNRRGPQNKTVRAPPAAGAPAADNHEGHHHHHG